MRVHLHNGVLNRKHNSLPNLLSTTFCWLRRGAISRNSQSCNSGSNVAVNLGLFILDRNYRVVQTAIRDCLGVLKKLLNIEVEDVITQRYRLGAVQTLMTFIYVFFVVGDLALGWVVLTKNFVNLVVLMIAGVVVLVTILALSIDFVVLNYRYGMVDWVMDKLECKQGESVRIIMTNLGNKDFPNKPLAENKEMWKLVRQCDAAGPKKNPNGIMSTIEGTIVCRQGQARLDSVYHYLFLSRSLLNYTLEALQG
jgi:hypothetical protein